jgi:hypothetical protein
MQKKSGENIDRQPYSNELGEKLKSAYIDLINSEIFISDWFYSNPPITKI